jgi:hypothetical protein
MATLISAANGNFTSTSTWKVINATSFLDSRSASSGSTTTGVNSSNFTPGAITVEGVSVQIFTRSSTLGGTFTVSLWNSTAGSQVSGTAVTIDVNDIPDVYGLNNTAGIGWVYFKFASPVTLLAATNYAVRVASSVNTSVTVYRDATGSNWSRALITSTTAAPAVTDVLIITGEYTGAGVSATRSVTMNNTDATAFGQTYVSTKGSLTYGNSASTSYVLRLGGNLFVTGGGTLTIGTALSPIDASSTAVLEFNIASTGQYGLNVVGGNFYAYGQRKSQYTRLGADVIVGATTLTLKTTPTGWLLNDVIGITGTTTTATQAEVRTLSANVTSASHTISSGLTNAHGGNSTTLVQAHVANLTRNVIIRSTSSTLPAYSAYNGTNTTVEISNVLFSMMGSTSTATAGISLFNAGVSRNASFSMTNSVLYQPTPSASAQGIAQGNTGTTSPVSYTITNNVIWNIQGTGMFNTANSAMSTKIMSGNLVVRSGGLTVQDMTADTSNTVVANSAVANAVTVSFTTNSVPYPTGTVTTLTNLETYGNLTNGLAITSTATSQATGKVTVNADNITSWRNGGSGISIGAVEFNNQFGVMVFDNFRSFGNTSLAVSITSISNSTVIFKSSTFWAGTTQVTPTGVSGAVLINPNRVESVLFTNCTFGKDHLGNTSSFTTSILALANFRGNTNMILYNPTTTGTLVARNTAYSNSSGYASGVVIQKLNNSTGSDFIYSNTSTISLDSVIYRSDAPSTRLAPAIAVGCTTPSPTVRIPVKSGQTCSVGVWVRKSTSGDGGAYNGGEPTLVIRPNLALNNLDNTTVDTMTATAGNWEQLTYTTSAVAYDTTLEFIVVCDGSTGWINIDDWSTTSSNDTRGDFIQSSVVGQYIEPDYSPASTSGGSSYTFIS